MKTIIHLRSTRGFYGAERALLGLCAELRQQSNSLVYALSSNPDLAAPFVAAAKVLDVPAFSVLSRRTGIDAVAELVDEVRRHRAHVLHAHDYKALAVAHGVSALTGLPVVATYHGDTAEDVKVWAYERLAHALARRCVAVAAPSAESVASLRRWAAPDRVHHIPNAIPSPSSAPEMHSARKRFHLPKEAFVIAVVGRLSPEKGHAVLFDALRSLNPQPLTVIAGTGPLEGQLRSEAAGIDIQWLGYVQNPEAVYAAADAVILPSLREGLPLTALEAMNAGCPIIASAVGELPQLLAQGRGLLFPKGDSATLARYIEMWSRRPEDREATSAAAQRYVRDHYTPAAATRAYWERVYRPALELRAPYAVTNVSPTRFQA